MRNGADAVIEALQRHEVGCLFGYPGGAVTPLYEALSHSGLRHVLVRSEQGAVHMASGYARTSGQVGVVLATSGPGATNLVTGIAAAAMDSVPLVLITGQVETFQIGTDAFQEVDITGITQPITKHNYLVKDVDSLPTVLDEAFHIAATGRPGPVLIDIPKDILQAPCQGQTAKQLSLPGYQPTVKGSAKQIKTALELFRKARQPLVYCGGGVNAARAGELLRQLAERMDAPVACTMMGLGALASDHPLNLGMIGLHGDATANRALCSADVILVCGSRFDDRVTRNHEHFCGQAKLVHVDVDPAEIGKNVLSRVPIVGDLRCVLNDLLSGLEQQQHSDWLAQIRQQQVASPAPAAAGFSSPAVLAALSALTPDNAIFTTDVGQHQVFAARYLRLQAGPTFLSCGGLGAMGYGVPAAIGASLASPHHKLFVITGDGSFQMNMNELATAVEQGVELKILLFNNSTLGMVRQQQHFYYQKNYFGVDFAQNPDFALIAAAYGLAYFRLDKAEDLALALPKALNHKGSALIECLIPKEEQVLPMVLSGHALTEMITED